MVGDTKADFDTPLDDLGVEVTRTPITKQIDNTSGDLTRIEGTSEKIIVIIENTNPQYTLGKGGLFEGADARMFIHIDQELNKWDKIEYQGNDYWVDTIANRNMWGDKLFQSCLLKRV